ncbi:O-antigen ligase family protein [Tenacibaculum sp. SDUM215027]|uniref:O-antigen ligase family protein n=1 Tax=Tenacibaculum sp. SDUM215027 TaxID=3422596 RepID=UPI003D315FDC
MRYFIDPYIKFPTGKIKFHVKMAIIFFSLGFLFINFSLLENSTRQMLSFSMFGTSVLFSFFELFPDILKRGQIKALLIGGSIILYTILFSSFVEPYGEYGGNKYPYFLFVIFISFITTPSLLKYENSVELFNKLLFYISLVLCVFSILYANPSLGRRGEFGLNPAILARLCMIAGIYITAVMFCKGITVFRVLILLLSLIAVFFTATKTPVPVFLFSFYCLVVKKINLKTGFKMFWGGVGFVLLSYIVLVNFIPSEFSERILDPKSLSTERQSVEGNRFQLYQLSWDILEKSVGGHGFGAFAKFHAFIVAPHNVILEISIELGILITICFLIWIYVILKRIRKMNIESVNVLFICNLFVYSLISSMFGGELTLQNLLLYLTGSFIILYGKNYYIK